VIEANICVRYDSDSKEWSVAINGISHHHLSSAAAEELVEYAIVALEQATATAGEKENEKELDLQSPVALVAPKQIDSFFDPLPGLPN
jgi:hypothetical protein